MVCTNFEDAIKIVREKAPCLSNHDLLYFYGYYKQATEHNCLIARPGGIFNRKEKAKYDAWKNCYGTSVERAKELYIQHLNSLNIPFV